MELSQRRSSSVQGMRAISCTGSGRHRTRWRSWSRNLSRRSRLMSRSRVQCLPDLILSLFFSCCKPFLFSELSPRRRSADQRDHSTAQSSTSAIRNRRKLNVAHRPWATDPPSGRRDRRLGRSNGYLASIATDSYSLKYEICKASLLLM